MKKVFEYMGIQYKKCLDDSRYPCVCKETEGDNAYCIHIDNGGTWDNCEQGFSPSKDGNLMVLAINSMREKGDWKKFFRYIQKQFIKTHGNKIAKNDTISFWLFGNPAKFFELMEEWMNEKAD